MTVHSKAKYDALDAFQMFFFIPIFPVGKSGEFLEF